MSLIDEITPTTQRKVMDLVREAGIDVSDWANFKGGEANASQNPKYCYEWAFVSPGRLVVLNLWLPLMAEREGTLVQEVDFRGRAGPGSTRTQASSIWEKRARVAEAAVQHAFEKRLPIRVIVCDGVRRDASDPNASASRVKRRMLDPIPWAAAAYDPATGNWLLKRGPIDIPVRDQYSVDNAEEAQPGRREITRNEFERDSEVRRQVRDRSKGYCEFCGEPGFITVAGYRFIETHHVIPMSEGGRDRVDNVVALCPNHHREAHHGNDMQRIRQALLERLTRISLDRTTGPSE